MINKFIYFLRKIFISKTKVDTVKEKQENENELEFKDFRDNLEFPLFKKIKFKENDDFQCTIIYDSRKYDLRLKEGFGFSCFIKFKDMKILFDTGGNQKDFFHNIDKLNISLNSITHVVFSHQHWDHTAGFEQVLKKVSSTTKIYLPYKFNSSLNKKVPGFLEEVNIIKDFEQIDKDCYSAVLKGSSMVLTECCSVYEQFLIFNGSKGLVVFTGCGHPGVGRILRYVKEEISEPIDLLIGGFHLHHSFNSTIDTIVKEVKSFGVKRIAPCHCTGEKAIAAFQEMYQEDCYVLGVGSVKI